MIRLLPASLGSFLLVTCVATPSHALAVPPLPLIPPECALSPFGDVSLVEYQASVIGECQDDATHLSVDAPKSKPDDVGPSLMQAEFSSMSTWRHSSMFGTMRFDWSGERGEVIESSQRASLSLGGLMKLHETFALQSNVGIEQSEAQRSRATFSGIWRPTPFGVMFAEWAGSAAGTESQRLGGRLWLVPRRLSFDIRLRHVPEEDGWVTQRVGLTLSLPL
jgi:hypothetical protein